MPLSKRMTASNPYETPNPSSTDVSHPVLGKNNNALIGFILGAAVPFAVGVILIVRFRMSLPPLQPGEAHCGTGALGPACLILFGTPIGAICGLVIGSLVRH